jgi:hypothetical protein
LKKDVLPTAADDNDGPLTNIWCGESPWTRARKGEPAIWIVDIAQIFHIHISYLIHLPWGFFNFSVTEKLFNILQKPIICLTSISFLHSSSLPKRVFYFFIYGGSATIASNDRIISE